MNEQQEELFDSLAEIDGGLIEEAYKIDNAKKLRRYSEDEKGVSVTKIRRYNILGKVAVAVACLCLCVITVFNVLPRLNNITPPTPGGDETPGESTMWGDPMNSNDVSSELIFLLNNELYKIGNIISGGDVSDIRFFQRLDMVNNGCSPIHMQFDSSLCYFLCAYFPQNNGHIESEYCCREKYTWVKFEYENDISQYYNGAEMVVAFQINIPIFCRNILSGTDDPINFEFYQRYYPAFSEGFNVNPRIDFEETFIYMNDSDDDTVYYGNAQNNPLDFQRDVRLIRCEKIDDQYYAFEYHYEVFDYQTELEYTFGKYCDYLSSVMITEVVDKVIITWHEEYNGNNFTIYKSYIKLEDLLKTFLLG